jgi:hypothetical protein
MTSSGAARHLQPRPSIVDGVGDRVEAEFAKDRWDAAVFTGIEQLWL